MKRINCDGIIFDMDGVLIDVTKSCAVATQQTVNFYLKQNGLKVRATKKDVNEIKLVPGFNNDWDASFMLVNLLSEGVSRKNFANFAKPLESSSKQELKYILVRNIWQVFYLGSNEFERVEKREAFFENSKPLRFEERLLISIDLLKWLAKKNIRLGIATSRPREEALFALKQFNLERFFPKQYSIGQEDVKREKPFPDSLIEAIKRMKLTKPIFIGDTINDCLAAKAAKIPCVYIGKEQLGDYRIKNVNQLMEVIL